MAEEKAENGEGADEDDEDVPTVEQDGLRLILEEIEEKIQDRMKYYDDWANRRLHSKVTSFTRNKEPKILEEQEKYILKWTNTTKIQVALSRKHIAEANSRRNLTRSALRRRTELYAYKNRFLINLKLKRFLFGFWF